MFKGFSEALQAVAQRYTVVRDALSQTERLDQETFIKYSREFSELEPLIGMIDAYHAAQKGLKEAEKGFKDLEGAQAKAKYALGKANKYAAVALAGLKPE